MPTTFDAIRYTLVDASGNPASVPTNTHDAERIQLVDGNGNVIDPSNIVNDSISSQLLIAWTLAQSFIVISATRDANEAITTASIAWPDGATGTFTTDTASTSFPGAIDAYHVTHVLNGTTKTITQAAVTRDAGGAVTAQPALTVV